MMQSVLTSCWSVRSEHSQKDHTSQLPNLPCPILMNPWEGVCGGVDPHLIQSVQAHHLILCALARYPAECPKYIFNP